MFELSLQTSPLWPADARRDGVTYGEADWPVISMKGDPTTWCLGQTAHPYPAQTPTIMQQEDWAGDAFSDD